MQIINRSSANWSPLQHVQCIAAIEYNNKFDFR